MKPANSNFKMHRFSLIILLLALTTAINGEVTFQGKKPPADVHFDSDSHTVEISNTHRPNAKVIFSSRGVNFTKVVEKHSNLWHIDLNDSYFVSYMSASDEKSYHATRHFFTWNNTNGHGHVHEVCFDLSFNGATW